MHPTRLASLGGLFILAALLACSTAPPQYACADGTLVADPTRCPPPTPTCHDGAANQGEAGIDCGGPCPGHWYDGACHAEPKRTAPPPPAPPPAAGLPAPMDDLFKKTEVVTNYQYVYDGAEAVRQDYAVLVKGEKATVKLADAKMLPGKKYFTVVYLDRAARTAEAWCQANTQCDRKAPGPFPVAYADWDFPTPFDWITRIKASPAIQVQGKATTYGRPTTRADFTYADQPARAWLDNFFGLPIRVEIGEDTVGIDDRTLRTYEYRDLATGLVKDQDLAYQAP